MQGIEESSTYQFILAKGRVDSRQEDLLLLLEEQFGILSPPNPTNSVNAMNEILKIVLGLIALVVAFGGIFAIVAWLLKKAQAEDRRYGGENDNGSGWPGPNG